MSHTPSILNEAADKEASTLEYLVSRGSSISTESAGLAFVDSVKSTFQDFVGRVSVFTNNLKVGNFTSRAIDSDSVMGKFNGRPYQENRNLYVTVQPGFEGKWLPYLKFLDREIMPRVTMIDATLKVAITKLATILNEPDRLKAQSGIRDLEKLLTLVSQTDYQTMTSYFGKNSKTQVRVAEIADRNADVVESYALINKLNRDLGKVDFTKIQAQLDRLTELTRSLKDVLESDENRVVSGTITSQLSDLFYKLGVTLTAGALLRDAVLMQTEAMQQSIDSLKTQLGIV